MNKTIDLLAPNSVICLIAPTASGKTALAYKLYETGRFELISVDSALVYRDMTIGTAKPTAEELRQYPHHLVDIIDPTESYSVANFVADVAQLISDIHARGKIPLLIGGTMMYYMALFKGLSNLPDSDANVRAEVETWRQQVGIEALHDYVKEVDPTLGARLKPTDTQRITRAVEVYRQTGKPLSSWQNQPKIALADNPNQQWISLSVMPDRAWVHRRIAQRLDIMWQQGLIAEVIELIHKYRLTANMASMRCVGYRQVIEYLMAVSVITEDKKGVLVLQDAIAKDLHSTLKDTLDSDELTDIDKRIAVISSWVDTNLEDDDLQQDMRNKALYATRQLAKRQYTWMRKLVGDARDTHTNDTHTNDTHTNDTHTNDTHTNANAPKDFATQKLNDTLLLNFDTMANLHHFMEQSLFLS